MILRNPKAPVVFGVLAITALVSFVTFYRASPGTLARPHDAVAGASLVTDCRKCHAPAGLAAGCLGCHAEIREQLSGKKGYHAFLLAGKKPRCALCHQDHHGADFPLVSRASWEGRDVKAFDHPHVDFRLRGKHAGLDCGKCHDGPRRPPFSLPDFPRRRREKTFLGLTQDCASCHEDAHAGGLSGDCASCHGQDGWKPSVNFSHDTFFPLTGGHAGVDCRKCHLIPAKDGGGERPRGFPFHKARGTSCRDCHESPHRAAWTGDCASCHGADGRPWAAAAEKMTPALHAAAGFRLAAPHDRVSCGKCHAGESFAARYPDPRARGYGRGQAECQGCHADAHGGQFVKKYPRCASCHRAAGFRPARFGPKEHAVYPLRGGHAAVPCQFCHKTEEGKPTRLFAGTPRDCASCHRDVHGGQFRQEGGTRCENCHGSEASWKALVFDHNKQSRFKLDEAHVGVECRLCHPRARAASGEFTTRYKPLKSGCGDCHGLDFRR